MMRFGERIFFCPPPERGRVVAAGDRVGIAVHAMTPTRLALLADLPLSGGGIGKRKD